MATVSSISGKSVSCSPVGIHWFVMRDLKRSNAKMPAYKMLSDNGFKVFTPMKWQLSVKAGKKVREKVPFLSDLVFVCSSRSLLDPVVEKTPTLQYRYLRNSYMEPMTVRDEDMGRFILATEVSDAPEYYLPEEITPEMSGRKIRIVGGPLCGLEGSLLTVRGSKVKRILVELPEFFSVGVEVNPEYIQVL